MHVLMLAWEYPPHVVGGMGKHVAELAPALAAEGVTVTVLTPLLRDGAAHEQGEPGITVFRFEPPYMEEYDYTTFVSQTNREMVRTARHLRAEVGYFDLIHTHDWLTAEAGVALKQQWRIPLVGTVHATERGRGRGYLNGPQGNHINHLEWLLTYESWQVIVCSAFMSTQVTETFSTPLDKVSVVPNGIHIHPNPFHSASERHAFRQHFVADDQRLALYVGRVVYEKGLHVLLDAWPQVLHQVDAKLVIAGAGPSLEDLKAHAAALGIGSRVIFTGFIADEDRDRLYHVADVAVFPSLYEPFGIVALEAFAAECPVVAADTGGLTEVVRLHETGILVHPNNPDSLAWGILHTLHRPDWARARAANALRDVREVYTWQQVARDTSTIYKRVYAAWQASSWGKELVIQQEAL